MSKTVVALLLCALVSCAKASGVDPAVQAALEAGKSTELPDFEALSKTEAVSGFVSSNTADTAALEALRENGQGVLYGPGRLEADACRDRGDPKCLAVQMVDRGAADRPVLDPDVSGELEAGRDEIHQNADEMVDLDGTGSSTGACRDVTSTVAKPEETLTCDVRAHREPGAGLEQSCTRRWEELHDEQSVWACRNVLRETREEVCSIPVTVRQETHSRLICLEGARDAQTETCPVTVTAGQKQKHYAACVRPLYRTTTKTCTRRLVVAVSASCRLGEEQRAQNADPGGLGEDDVPGADTLVARSLCTQSGFELEVSTNARTPAGTPVAFVATSDIFDTVVSIEGGQARFAGTVRCGKADCLAEVVMTVYKGSGTHHVEQGSVSLRFAFTRFVVNSETEQWSETCTDL